MRLHVHVAVDDLDQAVRFYSALFDADPTVSKPDYAKWAVADPAVNFSVSMRGGAAGVDHLGIEVDSAGELERIEGRMRDAEARIALQRNATCCYAKSDKSWIFDPQNVAWEAFLTHDQAETYGDDTMARALVPAAQACCDPE